MQPSQISANEVIQRVVMDWFLRGLPGEEQKAVMVDASQTPTELVEALETVLTTLDLG